MSNSSISQDKSIRFQSVLAGIGDEVRRHLNFTLGHQDHDVNPEYLYKALAIAVRDRLVPL